MEVNLMNVLKEEGPSVHLAVGEIYPMNMEAWIGQEHPHIFWSYLMSSISLIRIGRYQNVITRARKYRLGQMETSKKCWRIIGQELILPTSNTASI